MVKRRSSWDHPYPYGVDDSFYDPMIAFNDPEERFRRDRVTARWGEESRYREPEALPPPPKPSEGETKTWFASGVVRTDYFDLIKLSTFEEVAEVIRVFAGGSPTAFMETIKQIGEDADRRHQGDGGLATGYALLGFAHGQSEDSFAERVIKKAEASLAGPRYDGVHAYQGDWDYDGPGPFHKASISVTKVEDGFLFGTYAAYIGNQSCVRLAKKLGLEPGLRYITIKRNWETTGKRFKIPFGILYDIISALGQKPALPTPTQMLEAFAGCVKPGYNPDGGHWPSSLSIYDDGQIKVHVQPASLHVKQLYDLRDELDGDERRQKFDEARRKDPSFMLPELKLKAEKGFITGPAKISHYGLPHAGALEFSISGPSNPVFDETIKAQMLAIGNTIEQILK